MNSQPNLPINHKGSTKEKGPFRSPLFCLIGAGLVTMVLGVEIFTGYGLHTTLDTFGVNRYKAFYLQIFK